MMISVPVGGPYAHARNSVRRTMGLVLVALLPATLFNLYVFGWPAINLFVLTIMTALLAESLCLALARRPQAPFLTDGSAILTGWLLAQSLPPWAPWWVGVLGALLAIVVGKHVFGGLGQNLFNPAMVARAVLLISFPLPMTAFVTPAPLGEATAPGFLEGLAITFGTGNELDAFTGPTILSLINTELSKGVPVDQTLATSYQPLAQLLGLVPGSLGETSALLLLLGGTFLIYKGVIRWYIPVALLATLGGLATAFYLFDPSQYAPASLHLLGGATLLAAFFIATDLVTSPVTARGQLIFGAGCGVLIFVIRNWAGYPEGVAFAILLMNAMTPLLDRYIRPRVYGRTGRGNPISVEDGNE